MCVISLCTRGALDSSSRGRSTAALGDTKIMPATKGINHVGLAVLDLEQTTRFFVDGLGWHESGWDPTYPRAAVSDGHVRLTLWQVDHSKPVVGFNRRSNVGLHHLALEVSTEAELKAIMERLSSYPGATIEFSPELVGNGPRKHMMCYEPGGLRIEFIWPGA
jgi:catechol 2,3-dioxygenase-like lactoylglutathione lyase family enzyme